MTHEEKYNADLVIAEEMDAKVILETAWRRGWIMVPAQSMKVFIQGAETGNWPALYDADGKFL